MQAIPVVLGPTFIKSDLHASFLRPIDGLQATLSWIKLGNRHNSPKPWANWPCERWTICLPYPQATIVDCKCTIVWHVGVNRVGGDFTQSLEGIPLSDKQEAWTDQVSAEAVMKGLPELWIYVKQVWRNGMPLHGTGCTGTNGQRKGRYWIIILEVYIKVV